MTGTLTEECPAPSGGLNVSFDLTEGKHLIPFNMSYQQLCLGKWQSHV